MFTALELRNQLAFALDAEGSDHYRDDLDYIPAINAAMKWLTSIVNAAYGQGKIGEEFFRELSYSGVFQTSINSRVSLDVFPSEVWSILAVYVNPDVQVNTNMPVPNTPDIYRSYYLSNLTHLSAQYSCKRLNIEEWAVNKVNPFEAGFDAEYVCEDLRRYAYISPLNYNGVSGGFLSQEIEIRPKLSNRKVTIFWVKKPDKIVNITDEIGFPHSVFQLLFNKALFYISFKQGDGTTINSVSNADIQQLLDVL
jgi:hypothetical protein